MEKSTLYGFGIFIVIVVGGLMIFGGDNAQITGNVIAVEDGIVEVTTTIKGFKYNPDTITIKKGSIVRLTIQNKDNVLHGLHLPQFGIVGSTPALTTKTVQFKAIETSTNGLAVPTCSQEHGETLTFIIN